MKRATALLRSRIKRGYARFQDDDGHPISGYLTELIARVLENGAGQLNKSLRDRIHDHWMSEIKNQITLISAKSKNADVFQLAYGILLFRKNTEKLTPDEESILKAGLELFFCARLPDGTWPRSNPQFYYSADGIVFCYDYELLAQLLRCELLQDNLLHHLGHLAETAYLLRNNRSRLEPDGNVATNGFGWSSGHRPYRGPESWSTACVYQFAHALDRLNAEAIRRHIIRETNVNYRSNAAPEKIFAKDFLDSDIFVDGQSVSLKALIRDRMANPIRDNAKHLEERGRPLPKGYCPTAAIFFGPPGTSKTSLANSIAKYLGWPLLKIDPSFFTQPGMENISSRIDKLFDALLISERLVVLLDEFEEMVRDRAENKELRSRFLTATMLPKLAQINEERRIVMIVATNYIDSFDSAITRRGRFDLIAQVMPPTTRAKLGKWKNVKKAVDSFNSAEKKQVQMMLSKLTYQELEELVFGGLGTIENIHQFIQTISKTKCTLDEVVSEDGTTWDAVCRSQRDKVRIPPEYAADQDGNSDGNVIQYEKPGSTAPGQKNRRRGSPSKGEADKGRGSVIS